MASRLSDLDENDIVVRWIIDYKQLRDQARTCAR